MGAAEEELAQRRRRAARNQSLFREVNEQLEKLGERSGWLDEPIWFLCECLGTGCVETIRMDRDEYERVRAYVARFLVVAGHEDPTVETVVEKALRYTVIEKTGAGSVVAAASDPRQRASAA